MEALELTREAWLQRSGDMLRERQFLPNGFTIPKFHVSIGFTSTGRNGKSIGECWNAKASTDKVAHIHLKCNHEDSNRFLDILAHEMIHVLYPDDGHGKLFGRCARKIGLEGKLTATVAGVDLKTMLGVIVEELGDIPHAALDFRKSGKKKQSTRMVKCECGHCGYVVRTARKWISESGAPYCPCSHSRMEVV